MVQDDDNTGKVALSTLKQYMTTMGNPLSDEECRAFIKDCGDVTENSVVDYFKLAQKICS